MATVEGAERPDGEAVVAQGSLDDAGGLYAILDLDQRAATDVQAIDAGDGVACGDTQGLPLARLVIAADSGVGRGAV